ncbi:hypothetical protein BJX96DRAFT_155176 [Aspergillus floccosus]
MRPPLTNVITCKLFAHGGISPKTSSKQSQLPFCTSILSHHDSGTGSSGSVAPFLFRSSADSLSPAPFHPFKEIPYPAGGSGDSEAALQLLHLPPLPLTLSCHLTEVVSSYYLLLLLVFLPHPFLHPLPVIFLLGGLPGHGEAPRNHHHRQVGPFHPYPEDSRMLILFQTWRKTRCGR